VGSPECSVVDDPLGSFDQRREPREALHSDRSLSTRLRHPLDIEDDTPSLVLGPGGNQDELGPPRCFAVSLEVESRIGFVLEGADFPSLPVGGLPLGLCPEQRGQNLTVGMEKPAQMWVSPRPGPLGVEEVEFPRLRG